MKGLNPLDVSPANIENYRQNKPSYICQDLEELAGVPGQVTAKILMSRGVYKWLSVRRDLIALKDEWRDEIRMLYAQGRMYPRGSKERALVNGRIKALEECRGAIRALCHSPRWQFPDHDKYSRKILERGT